MGKNLYIFDCFGVVISEVSSLMEKYLTDEQKRYMREKVYRKLDLGLIGMDEMFDVLSKFCGMNVEQTKRKWADNEALLNDTVEAIKQLKAQGHCIALLSNAAVSYIDYLFEKYGLFQYFDRIFVSANYGYAKPDKELYKICVSSFTETFDKIYFTDDNPKNLTDLEQFGITPVLFKNAENFKNAVGLK